MERKGVSAESMQKSHTNLEGSPAFFRLNARSLKCFWLCCPPIFSSSAFSGGSTSGLYSLAPSSDVFSGIQRFSNCGARANGSGFFGSLYPVPGPRTSFRIAE